MLALLAVVAQLWVAQVGAGHLARMLSASAPWGDICSAEDGGRAGDDAGRVSHLRHALGCPACTAGASGSAPPLQAAALPLLLADTAATVLPLVSSPLVHCASPAGRLPPSQAPPARA